jgi:hypothetical protein
MVGVLTEDVTPRMDRLHRRQCGSDEKQGAAAPQCRDRQEISPAAMVVDGPILSRRT